MAAPKAKVKIISHCNLNCLQTEVNSFLDTIHYNCVIDCHLLLAQEGMPSWEKYCCLIVYTDGLE